ncbi:PilZ-like domain-containing protein [Geobacter sp. FeAm09]|uniref:PilZ-like domain-containing protein n=1 Tax=Geobacter sp. FeAm09 TaxID=2597769 RepID=UPI00143DDB99|nr:PilZ-like domain-containing protein [Geobacter sp. FeAm09]
MNAAGQYPSRYVVGMKVEVGIPLPNARVFRDWAIVNEMDEDLVSLQLSRDMLPEGVSLRVGQLLTIRSESDGQACSCRAFIVSKGYEQDLLLRLTGEIVSDELREFYRIDAFLPIKFHPLHDQDPATVKKQWEERQKERREEERVRELRRWEARRERVRAEERARERLLDDAVFDGAAGPFVPFERREEPEDNAYYESWGSVTSVAINISAGGLKVLTDREFTPDELLLLEIFVPSSRSIVDIVARVVFSNRNAVVGGERNCCNTGMQFVFIDERTRFAINRHVSGVQIQRIRQFKGFADVEPLNVDTRIPDKHYAYTGGVDAGDAPERTTRRKMMQHCALGLLLLAIAGLLWLYFSGYAAGHPKNQIQDLFENGLKGFGGHWMRRE